MKSAINKYLANYCEVETEQLTGITWQSVFDYSLVIPAYQEEASFVEQLLKGVLKTHHVLLIIVVNQPDSDTDIQPQLCLWQQIHNLAEKSEKLSAQLSLLHVSGLTSKILLVDRFHHAIPKKQGVGLARKIGCDIALSLIAKKQIQSQYIASSDADAILPDNYFYVQSTLTTHHSAGVYAFEHVGDGSSIHHTTQLYEASLRYYVDGLMFANSPYAFFTIGSLLLFQAQAYANVRGFPKKSAGEDFYLLNKLAKIGEVANLASACIHLKARTSQRVPFGTGPAVSKMLIQQEQGITFDYYHPDVFVALKALYQALPLLFKQTQQTEDWLAQLPIEIKMALFAIGFNEFMKQHSSSSAKQFEKQWHVWFDAFKTLKFIHYLRDHYFPNTAWDTIQALKPF